MSTRTASDLITRMIQPTGTAPCAGCGEIVETATVLGRTVYACDDCAEIAKISSYAKLAPRNQTQIPFLGPERHRHALGRVAKVRWNLPASEIGFKREILKS